MQRLDTQRLQQEQNWQAIELAMEHVQTVSDQQKLQSARQVRAVLSSLFFRLSSHILLFAGETADVGEGGHPRHARPLALYSVGAVEDRATVSLSDLSPEPLAHGNNDATHV